MKELPVDFHEEFISTEEMTGQKIYDESKTLGLKETEQTQLSGDRLSRT